MAIELKRNSFGMSKKLWEAVVAATVTWFNFGVSIAAIIAILVASNEQFPVPLKIIMTAIVITGVSIGIIRRKSRTNSMNQRPLLTITIYTSLVSLALLFVAKIESPFAFLYIMPIFLVALYYEKRHVNYMLSIIFAVLMLQPIVFYALVSDYAPNPTLTIDDFGNNLITFILIVIIARLITVTTLVNEEDRDLMQTSVDELSHEHTKTHSLIESVDLGVISTDEKWRIEEFNTAFMQMFSINSKVLGSEVPELLELYEKSLDLGQILNALSNNEGRKVVAFNTKQQDPVQIDVKVKRVPSEGQRDKTSYVIIFHDVTSLRSETESRKAFVSLMSHELRTPLAKVEAQLSLALLLVNKKDDAEKVGSQVDDAYNEVLKLMEINNNMITLLEIEQNEARPDGDEITPNEIYEQLAKRLGKLPANDQLEISYKGWSDSNATINTNLRLLVSSLAQLADNAVKFTQKGSVDIQFNEENDQFVFQIKDTGLGISASTLEQLNESIFVQAEDHENRNKQGLGMGLMLAKIQLEAIKAEFDIHSELGKGTIVTVVLSKN